MVISRISCELINVVNTECCATVWGSLNVKDGVDLNISTVLVKTNRSDNSYTFSSLTTQRQNSGNHHVWRGILRGGGRVRRRLILIIVIIIKYLQGRRVWGGGGGGRGWVWRGGGENYSWWVGVHFIHWKLINHFLDGSLSDLPCQSEYRIIKFLSNHFSFHQRRWQLPKGKTGSEEGRAWRAAERIYQRVEETKVEGGGGAASPEGEAGQEEGDQGGAGEKTGSTEEGGGGEIQERGGG